MREEIRELVRQKRQNEIKASNPNYDEPFKEFMAQIYAYRHANVVGTYFAPKLEHDLKGILAKNDVKIEKGDSTILNDVNFELKFSIKHTNAKRKVLKSGELAKPRTIHRMCNIRPWQQFEFFILGLADPDKDFDLRFFVLPKVVITENPNIKLLYQNNTTKSNEENNAQPGMSCSFSEEIIQEQFVKHNLLNNETYEELLNYLTELYKKHERKQLIRNTILNVSTNVSKPVSTPVKKQITRNHTLSSTIKFVVDNKTEITGKSAIEAMANLITHIGPNYAYGAILKFWLAKEKSEFRTVKLGKYYFNPIFSIDEIKLNVDLLNKKGKHKITIVETSN